MLQVPSRLTFILKGLPWEAAPTCPVSRTSLCGGQNWIPPASGHDPVWGVSSPRRRADRSRFPSAAILHVAVIIPECPSVARQRGLYPGQFHADGQAWLLG